METGPTGPTGIELSGAKAYDPAIASTYSVGQVVTYEGGTYIVDSAPPLGTPDTSPDYTLLAAPVLQVQQVAQVLLDLLAKRESTGATGPTGLPGLLESPDRGSTSEADTTRNQEISR